jgi:hypothetical protein
LPFCALVVQQWRTPALGGLANQFNYLQQTRNTTDAERDDATLIYVL